MVRRGIQAVGGRAAFRPVAAYGGSRRERNGVLRIVMGPHVAQDCVMFAPICSESDRSDGQRHVVHQQYAGRFGVVSAGIPHRDLSLTAAPLASGRFFSVMHACVNALWRSGGAAARPCISADSTE